MNRDMLDLLACPADGEHPLELHERGGGGGPVTTGALWCPRCSRFYPVVRGIPVMLPDGLRDAALDRGFLEENASWLPAKVSGGRRG